MSSILLVGLADHDSAALEIMIGMHWRDWRSVTLRRNLSLVVPEQNAEAQACRACVLDLYGMGMRRHTPEVEARLLEFLAGRSAVLLFWGQGGGWLERQLKLAPGQHLVWLCAPYSTVALRDALKPVIAAAEAQSMARPATPRRPAAAFLGGAAPAPAAPSRFSLSPQPAPVPAPPALTPSPAPVAVPAASVPAWRRALALAEKLKGSEAAAAPAPTPTPSRSVFRSTTPQEPSSEVREPLSLLVWPASAPSVSPPAPTPESRASGAPSLPLPTRRPGESAPAAPPVTPMAAQMTEVSQAALGAVFHAFPTLAAQPLAVLVGKIMSSNAPLLMRMGSEVACVTYAQQGWLASSVPLSALLKMLQTPHVVASVALMTLPPERVEDTVRQNFGGRFQEAQKPLDVLAWELLSFVLRETPLSPNADFSFQLQGFPNFTELSSVGGLDIQLAAISARMPQALGDLARAFPKHEQEAYRFAVLSVLSGLAVVTRLPSAPAPAPAPVAPPPPQTTARRGFFKSLLDKLF